MDVGGFLKALEDGAVVGLGLGASGVADQAGNLRLLSQGELVGNGFAALGSRGSRGGFGSAGAAAAAGEQRHGHNQSHDQSEGSVQFAHLVFSFYIIMLHQDFAC